NITRISDNEAIVASVPKDAFKAMFYLFAGKPDSRSKSFSKKIQINKQSIIDLNSSIRKKFELHQIDQVVTTVSMAQKGKEATEFGIWSTFEEHDFKIPEVTESVLLKWDFLIKLESYAAPQRHTLSVKIIKSPTAEDVLRRVFTQQDEEDDSGSGVCTVRVDFINHMLADELINVVEKWNKTLSKCSSIPSFVEWAVKYDHKIARAIHYSISTFVLILIVALVGHYGRNWTELYRLAQVVILGVAAFHIAVGIGRYFASKAYSSINESAEYFPFCITSGDINAIEDSRKSTLKHLRGFLFSCSIAFSINIACAITVFKVGLS
ncbi:MAG TPA: hypothetical protein DDW91_11115, partial [Shewanella frigidimarina]|nr:hypothetical protein [Shewanella frigidimarina]